MKLFTEYPECSSSENSTPSLFACSESSYLKAYRDDKQKTSAEYSLSTVEGIQQISRSRQYSRRRSDSAVRCGRTLRIDQIVDTNRSRRGAGVHVYNPHLLDKARALVPPPSCLGEGPHRWVPVDTHSTPVLTSVRRLWGGLSNFTSPIHHRNTRNPYRMISRYHRMDLWGTLNKGPVLNNFNLLLPFFTPRLTKFRSVLAGLLCVLGRGQMARVRREPKRVHTCFGSLAVLVFKMDVSLFN